MDLRISGKRALVTGATGGIGEAAAVMLAAEGAVVAVNGRSLEKIERVVRAIQDAGGAALPALGDMDTDEGLDAVAASVKGQLGGIDILVNNVGGAIYSGARQWLDVPAEDWLTSFRHNVGSAARLIGHFAPGMREAGWGRIINVSSIAGVAPTATNPEYQASKAALNNLTKSLSKALSQTGVTANTIIPGIVLTQVTRDWIGAYAAKQGWQGDFDDHQRRYARDVRPLDVIGFGEPEDIAFAIVMLASPRSGYINGTGIRVDGGSVGIP